MGDITPKQSSTLVSKLLAAATAVESTQDQPSQDQQRKKRAPTPTPLAPPSRPPSLRPTQPKVPPPSRPVYSSGVVSTQIQAATHSKRWQKPNPTDTQATQAQQFIQQGIQHISSATASSSRSRPPTPPRPAAHLTAHLPKQLPTGADPKSTAPNPKRQRTNQPQQPSHPPNTK